MAAPSTQGTKDVHAPSLMPRVSVKKPSGERRYQKVITSVKKRLVALRIQAVRRRSPALGPPAESAGCVIAHLLTTNGDRGLKDGADCRKAPEQRGQAPAGDHAGGQCNCELCDG